MQNRHWRLWWTFVFVGIVGCGGSNPTSQTTTSVKPQEQVTQTATGSGTQVNLEETLAATTADPASAVATFLEAVRCGDDEKTAAMFTPTAREKVNSLGIQVAPPGSDTAKFVVGKVEMLADDGARVESQWSDVDQEGNERSDQITLMVRKERNGWRVAGMAVVVFPGEPPLLLDFEKPDETRQKLDMVKEEIRRRAEAASKQAQLPEESGNSVQR